MSSRLLYSYLSQLPAEGRAPPLLSSVIGANSLAVVGVFYWVPVLFFYRLHQWRLSKKKAYGRQLIGMVSVLILLWKVQCSRWPAFAQGSFWGYYMAYFRIKAVQLGMPNARLESRQTGRYISIRYI
jgi:hypothetical protein